MFDAKVDRLRGVFVCSRTVSKLAVKSTSPALKRVIVQNDATIVYSHRDGRGRLICAEIDGLRSVFIGIRPYAKLTAIINSPALKGVIVQDGAGVVLCKSDGLGGFVCTKINGLGSVLVGSRPGSEFAVLAISPTFERVIIQNSAGMIVVKSDGLGGFICAEVDGLRSVFVGIRSVSESAKSTHSPTLKGVIVKDGTGVAFSESEGLGGFVCTKINGLGSVFVGSRPNAESAVTAVSPTLNGVVV